MCEYWELNIEKHQPTVEVRYDNLTLHIRKTSVKFFLKELGGKEVRLNFSFLYFYFILFLYYLNYIIIQLYIIQLYYILFLYYLNSGCSEFSVLFITLKKKIRLFIYNNIGRCLWVVLWRDCHLHSNKIWQKVTCMFEIINFEVFQIFCLDIIFFYFSLKVILTVQI